MQAFMSGHFRVMYLLSMYICMSGHLSPGHCPLPKNTT